MFDPERMSLETLSDTCLDRRARMARGRLHTTLAAVFTLAAFVLVGALATGWLP